MTMIQIITSVKKCGLKVARFFGDRELQNEDFPVSTFLP